MPSRELYVGVLEGAGDAWRVEFFDIDGCYGEGATPETAIAEATKTLRDWAGYAASIGLRLPAPGRGKLGDGLVAVFVPLDQHEAAVAFIEKTCPGGA
jgi:hypothetical protein